MPWSVAWVMTTWPGRLVETPGGHATADTTVLVTVPEDLRRSAMERAVTVCCMGLAAVLCCSGWEMPTTTAWAGAVGRGAEVGVRLLMEGCGAGRGRGAATEAWVTATGWGGRG